MILQLILFFVTVDAATNSTAGTGSNPATGVIGTNVTSGSAGNTTTMATASSVSTRITTPSVVPQLSRGPITTALGTLTTSAVQSVSVSPVASPSATYVVSLPTDTPYYSSSPSSSVSSTPSTVPTQSAIISLYLAPTSTSLSSQNLQGLNQTGNSAQVATAANIYERPFIIGISVCGSLLVIFTIVCLRLLLIKISMSKQLPLSTITVKSAPEPVEPGTANPMAVQNWPTPKPADLVSQPTRHVDDGGEFYIIIENERYYLDGKDGRLLAKGWRRVSECDEVWYTHAEKEPSWTPIYETN